MAVVPRDLELSRKRAPHRELVLIYIACVVEASLWEISADLGIRTDRVRGIMEGLTGDYAKDLSLTEQGAVEKKESPLALRYAVLPRGVEAAESALERLGLR